jgi:hypothetical protein
VLNCGTNQYFLIFLHFFYQQNNPVKSICTKIVLAQQNNLIIFCFSIPNRRPYQNTSEENLRYFGHVLISKCTTKSPAVSNVKSKFSNCSHLILFLMMFSARKNSASQTLYLGKRRFFTFLAKSLFPTKISAVSFSICGLMRCIELEVFSYVVYTIFEYVHRMFQVFRLFIRKIKDIKRRKKQYISHIVSRIGKKSLARWNVIRGKREAIGDK